MHMESVPGTGHWSLEGLSESLSFPRGFPGDSDSEGSACNAGALFQDGLSALYQLAGTIAARPVKVWEHCRAGWLLGDTGATDYFPPIPPTALAAGKASWGVSSQQLPAGPATTSNPQTVRNAQHNLAFQGCVYPPPSDSRCHLQQLPVGAGSVVYNTGYSAFLK